MKLISGNANIPFAHNVAQRLSTPLTECNLRRFNDQEIFCAIKDNIRGDGVFIIQPTSYPANDHVMELLVLIDAAKRASSKKITAVLPYFGYARQDRKTESRAPITAKLMANLLTTAGADRILTLDLHVQQIQGFFDIPLDNLQAAPVFERDIRERRDLGNLCIVSPDIGGVGRARALAKRLGVPIVIVDKRRERAGESEVMNLIGEFKGKDCILIDDIVDSGGTLANAASELMKNGAKTVSAYITHGVLSYDVAKGIQAADRIAKSELQELVITDSIAQTEHVKKAGNIRVLSVAELMAEAIERTAKDLSVSVLFD